MRGPRNFSGSKHLFNSLSQGLESHIAKVLHIKATCENANISEGLRPNKDLGFSMVVPRLLGVGHTICICRRAGQKYWRPWGRDGRRTGQIQQANRRELEIFSSIWLLTLYSALLPLWGSLRIFDYFHFLSWNSSEPSFSPSNWLFLLSFLYYFSNYSMNLNLIFSTRIWTF